MIQDGVHVMTDRERLLHVLKFIPIPPCGFKDPIVAVVDHLLNNGVTITPEVPGPSEADHNIMELCFRNGEQHMKEKIIARLMEHKTQVKGVCHAHVVEIVKMVEGL